MDVITLNINYKTVFYSDLRYTFGCNVSSSFPYLANSRTKRNRRGVC